MERDRQGLLGLADVRCLRGDGQLALANARRSGAFFWASRLIRRTTSRSSAAGMRSSCSNVSG